MAYRIGQLTQRIAIERDVTQSDGAGGQEKTATIIANIYAYVRNKSTRELLAAQQVSATASVIFVVRWRDDVLPSDRLVWKGVRYNITSPLDLNSRNPFLEIEAERGVAS
jgi:SPP1 family predicted phage head-tail adaptor